MSVTSQGYYISKSGVEIQAVFGNTKFGDLHMIKYATQRDVANIHVMGEVNAVSVARGKRATTGACVFAVFEKDRLIEAIKGTYRVFLTNNEIVNYPASSGNSTTSARSARSGGSARTDGPISGSIFDAGNYGDFRDPTLVDQIPPFDITLVGISEASGHASRMVIQGVQFNSDQGGSSIDDLTLERQLTFLARGILPWTELRTLNGGQQAGAGWGQATF